MQLQQYDQLPESLIECVAPNELHRLFPDPTLIHLTGRREQPLFVSILLHGNEDTGFYALKKLLHKYRDQELPRSLSIYLGNTEAAEQGLRHLPGRPDFNRTWPTTTLDDCAETRLMAELTDVMAARKPFASIDVHNNTGKNPHYGCINHLEPRFLHLSTLFSRTVVYFETPKGVQAMAMAAHCPAVTIECGKPGVANGIEHAFEFLDAVLNLAEIPDHSMHPQDVDVYHTVARVQVAENVDFSFSRDDATLRLSPEIETYNFSELEAGAVFGEVTNSTGAVIHAWNDIGEDMAGKLFEIDHGRLTLSRSLMPSMLTLDEEVIRQDCLCYLMERLPLPEH